MKLILYTALALVAVLVLGAGYGFWREIRGENDYPIQQYEA